MKLRLGSQNKVLKRVAVRLLLTLSKTIILFIVHTFLEHAVHKLRNFRLRDMFFAFLFWVFFSATFCSAWV